MLDGGISDSIPVKRAESLGYDNCVVVLTRNRGYRKRDRESFFPPIFYLRYPALRKAIRLRNLIYNKQITYVEELEAQHRIMVIRPERPIDVDRMERDTRKLEALYNEGYAIASEVEFMVK